MYSGNSARVCSAALAGFFFFNPFSIGIKRRIGTRANKTRKREKALFFFLERHVKDIHI